MEYITQKEFNKYWNHLLKSEGWQQEKKTFFGESDFSLIIIERDCSPFRPDFSVECGICIKELGCHQYKFDPKIIIGYYHFPKFNHCHLYFDANELLPKNIENQSCCFSRENGFYDKESVDIIFTNLKEHVFPILRQCLIKNDFLHIYKKTKSFQFAFIHKEVQDWIKYVCPDLDTI
ncbi:MAG: hypothetical protein LBU34_08320 [Planctomycetaceae bacterium]|jgi:hypothetical protein|nr:hypothetical protein [Planctomycetaceae bacterium]